MTLYCQVKGCKSTLEINDSVSPAALYSCREHTEKGEDKVRFQEVQFDPTVGSGIDPKAYERGSGFVRPSRQEEGNREVIKKSNDKLIDKIEVELAEHENRDEILKILNEDIRDSNSGITDDE